MPGTAAKLNGWHRLGILLSVFWMIAVGIEWWVEVRQGPFSTGWVTDTVESKAPPIQQNNVTLKPVEQVVNIARFLVALIAPPIALWALGFSTIWVRRGFQGRSNSPGIAKLDMSEDAKWHWAEGNKYAVEAAKSILLVNGAAAVAMLTFIGTLKLQPTPTLIFSMVIFALAAVASALLFVIAYLTQLHYGNQNIERARRWHSKTYILLLIIVVLFISGISLAAHGFFNLPPANPCDLPIKSR